MAGYFFSCFVLLIFLLAFIPAMIAASKKRRFTGWYVYSLFLLPVALAHSLTLKRPRHFIKVYRFSGDTPTKRLKKIYAAYTQNTKKRLSFRYVCMVFLSKLLFSALFSVVLFALFRTFTKDTILLRATFIMFAVVFSALFSTAEILGISKLPLIADEITKRALEIVLVCIFCSAPLYLIKVFVLDAIIPLYGDFSLFICTVISLVLFVYILLSRQSRYYAFFNKFFDYCTISLLAYTVFAAASLTFMSVVKSFDLHFAFVMPVQGFNLGYLSGVHIIKGLSHIYSAAFMHLFFIIILVISGFLCRNFKRKEILARIEYRSRAFNMTQRKILRRHIPKPKTASVKK